MRLDNNKRPPSSIKILFLVTEDWYFISHRLVLARACRDLGWEVTVATYVQDHGLAIEREGFRVIPIRMRRRDRAPWKEIRSLLELVLLLKRERPHILHQVGLKPVIYGSIAAILVRPCVVVNALAGLGYIFTSGRLQIRLARTIIKAVLKVVLRRPRNWLIVQNDADAESMVAGSLISQDHIAVIKGSGVNLDQFAPTPEPEDPITVTMVSRMLNDKGVREVVLAARELKRRGTPVRMWLVGAPDPANPSSLDAKALHQWHREGCVEWLEHRNDIADVWAQSHIAILPSYREGMPKSLLEAAACGKPIVTADVPGCNDLVIDGVTGFLVPAENWIRLADAVDKLTAEPELRKRMGAAARAKVELEYSETIVVRATLDLYARALTHAGERISYLARESLRS